MNPQTKPAKHAGAEEWPVAFSHWMDQFFDRPFFPAFRSTSSPALDLVEQANRLVITMELPGMTRDDIHVDLEGKRLVVWGERKVEDEKRDGNVHVMESRYGKFRRDVALPADTREEDLEARYHNGVLELIVPLAKTTPSRHIEVQGD